MKNANYGVQISSSIISKFSRELRTYIYISFFGSIIATLVTIQLSFSGGIKLYFKLLVIDLIYYIKTHLLENFAKENDFRAYETINQYWTSYSTETNFYIFTFIASFIVFALIAFFVAKKIGKKYQQGSYERKDELHFVKPSQLIDEIKEETERKNNNIHFTEFDIYISLSKIRVPYMTSSLHFGLGGASATGKTNVMNEMLHQDRKLGSKVLIVDPRGQFFEKHGKPGDHILSLYDKRQKKWDFWSEQLPFQFLADALVEVKDSSSQTKFFDKSGRQVLAAALRHTKCFAELWQVVNYDEEDLYKFLVDKNELSKQLLGKKASGQSAGIIASSILDMGFIKSINHHVYEREKETQTEEQSFSLSKWVENDSDSSWVFIIDDNRNLSEAKPLHRLWFDIVTSSAYDRDIKKTDLRQINLYCDEVTTVGNLPTLPSVLDKGRNYKVRLVIGFQSYHQLEIIYGKEMAKNIFQGLQNVFVFASNDKTEARIFADRMGENEVIEVDTSLSLQADHSNTNLSQRIRQVDCVTPSQIQALKDNECFLKLARFNPTKVEFKFQKLEDVNIGSLSEVPERTRFDDIELIDYVSLDEQDESQNNPNDKKPHQLNDINELVKNLVEIASALILNPHQNDNEINFLAQRILKHFGLTGGIKTKIGNVKYSISILKEKEIIFITCGESEFGIPFPKINASSQKPLTTSDSNEESSVKNGRISSESNILDKKTPTVLPEDVEGNLQSKKFKTEPLKFKKKSIETERENEL